MRKIQPVQLFGGRNKTERINFQPIMVVGNLSELIVDQQRSEEGGELMRLTTRYNY